MDIHPYLDSTEIALLIEKLAKKVSDDYTKLVSPDEPLIVVVTLKGAMFFAADILRHISVPVCVDFVRLASYGSQTKSSGTVRFLKDIEIHLLNRHVLVLDEIVDSGRTIDFLIRRLRADIPKTLKVCALLSKPSRREVEVEIDYLGKEVEDKFLVGYGLDYNENFRNLKDIYYL